MKDNEAKRPCSTSTTPKSGKGMDPDKRDRLMEINSVDFSSEEDGRIQQKESLTTWQPQWILTPVLVLVLVLPKTRGSMGALAWLKSSTANFL